MVLELVVTILEIFTDPIKEYIITPLKNHISYAFTLDSKVERLHREVQKLQDKRVRLQQSVVAATRNGEEIFPNVTEWLSSAEKDIEEGEKLVQGKEAAQNKCCSGFCPNVKTRYQLSKRAHKKALVMDEQLQTAQGLDPIAFRPPPPPIIELPSGEALQSRVVILDQIVDALKGPNLNPIVVHGMGGIGKTTLAKELQAAVLKLFDDVVFVAVSETPDMRRIQGDIADALGLQFQAEGVPGRGRELQQRLKKANALIILDDVWEKLDLNAIGIPSGEASKGCKVFLTSRKKDVLCSEMHTKKEFPLGLVEEEEAWRLFEKIVNTGDDPEFLANNLNLAKEVANKCGGLPLLIRIVATDLRNHKHLYAWEDMLKQIEDVEGTEIEDKVHNVIESSYKNLKDEKAKSLFLLCPLFGNSNIRIHDLLLYGMGLGLFKRDSIEESRNRVLTLIDRLKNESLLLDGDRAGFVKIHDVIRGVAAAIALEEHCAFVGKGQIKSIDLEREDYRRISLPYCEIPSLPEVLQCPEAEVFSLFAEDLSLHIPASCFKGVRKLKVLHFSGVSFESGLPSSPDSGDSALVDSCSDLPSSLGFLTGLQTLSLRGCKLNNVAIIAELKHLEFLSFVGSNIAELPKEMKALTRLKLLDLTRCYNLHVIPSDVLSNLRLLEELHMLKSFDGWDTEGNASLVELKNLSRLTTLKIRVKDDKLLPDDWFFNGIQNYKIFVGDWDWSGAMDTSRMLKLQLKTSMGLMHRIKEFIGGIEVLYLHEVNGIENLLYDSSMKKINSFRRLRVLHIQECNSLRELLPFSSGKCLPHLQELEVRSCSNMEAIFGDGNEDEVVEFPQLISLKLLDLRNLRGICRTCGTVFLPNLTSLEISQCESLKYVFTTLMVKCLKQLKELQISLCLSMEEIILDTKFEAVEEDNINMIVFPKLDFLRLGYLRKLKRFISGYPIEFPKLRELKIEGCHEMKNFVSKDSDTSNNNETTEEYLFHELVIPNVKLLELDRHSLEAIRSADHGYSDASLWKLKELTLVDLEEESVPFLFVFLRRIYSVEKLTIKNSYVGEIFPLHDARAIGDEEPPYHLIIKYMHLVSVSNLKHIVKEDSQSNPIFHILSVRSCDNMMNIAPSSVSFINLTTLHVIGCNNMTSLVTASTAKSMIQLIKLKVQYCRTMRDIIVANDYAGDCTEEHDDVITFNKLENLSLYGLRSLNSFCSGNYMFNFPLLEQVSIQECYKMKIFCSGVVRTPKLQYKEILTP